MLSSYNIIFGIVSIFDMYQFLIQVVHSIEIQKRNIKEILKFPIDCLFNKPFYSVGKVGK